MRLTPPTIRPTFGAQFIRRSLPTEPGKQIQDALGQLMENPLEDNGLSWMRKILLRILMAEAFTRDTAIQVEPKPSNDGAAISYPISVNGDWLRYLKGPRKYILPSESDRFVQGPTKDHRLISHVMDSLIHALKEGEGEASFEAFMDQFDEEADLPFDFPVPDYLKGTQGEEISAGLRILLLELLADEEEVNKEGDENERIPNEFRETVLFFLAHPKWFPARDPITIEVVPGEGTRYHIKVGGLLLVDSWKKPLFVTSLDHFQSLKQAVMESLIGRLWQLSPTFQEFLKNPTPDFFNKKAAYPRSHFG